MRGDCKASKQIQTDIKIHIGPNSERTNNMERNQGNVSRGERRKEGHSFLGTVILYPFITITMINLRLFLFLNKQD